MEFNIPQCDFVDNNGDGRTIILLIKLSFPDAPLEIDVQRPHNATTVSITMGMVVSIIRMMKAARRCRHQ